MLLKKSAIYCDGCKILTVNKSYVWFDVAAVEY